MVLSFARYIIVVIILNFVGGETFFLSPTGIDNPSCASLENACATVEYVMLNLVDGTGGSYSVIVDYGLYNYSLPSSDFPGYRYSNFILNMTGYLISSSTMTPGDIGTYPVIVSVDRHNQSSAFHFYADITASFSYLSFVIDSNAYENRRIFSSLNLIIFPGSLFINQTTY
jgi:hypothetical protein